MTNEEIQEIVTKADAEYDRLKDRVHEQYDEIKRLTFESTKWESKFYDEAKKVDKAIECIEKSWNDKCTIPLEEVGYSTDNRWEIWKILKGSDKE